MHFYVSLPLSLMCPLFVLFMSYFYFLCVVNELQRIQSNVPDFCTVLYLISKHVASRLARFELLLIRASQLTIPHFPNKTVTSLT